MPHPVAERALAHFDALFPEDSVVVGQMHLAAPLSQESAQEAHTILPSALAERNPGSFIATGMSERMNKNFIEFFAGVGLIHEALVPLGWKALLGNDNDPKKAKIYRENYPHVPFNSGCISELDVSGLPIISLATASFPCIDLSQAGNREGIHGKHSGFVWTFLEKIRELQRERNAPQFLLLENVTNLLTIDDGKAVDFLLRSVADLGYALDLVQVDAVHFTPQSRNRVFLIAVRRDEVPSPVGEFKDHHIRRYRVHDAIKRNASLPWHFFDFPMLPQRQLTLDDVIEPLAPDDRRWWDEAKIAYFWDLVEHDHREKLKALLEAGGSHHFTAVRRLRRRRKREQIFNVRFDGLASCLRTPKGGSSTQYVIELRNGTLRGRRLMGIEAARLQGVALKDGTATFVVPETENGALHAFGDAVCVPAVRWVMEHSIERLLGGITLSEPLTMFNLLEAAA